MKFNEGDEVLAKAPASGEFEKGKVVNVRGTNYRVKLKGGSEITLKEADIKPTSRSSRSATRTKGRPTKKSPTRSSPSRRSPSRRSPGRPTNQSRKLPVRSSRLAQVSPSDDDKTEGSSETSASIRDEDPAELAPLQSRLRDVGPTTRRSIRLLSNTAKAEQEQKLIMLTRTVDRAASLPLDRKGPAYDSLRESKERGFSMQREQDLPKVVNYGGADSAVLEKHKKEIDLVSKPQEWGGWFGVLLLIIIGPLSILLPQFACSSGRCSIAQFRVSKDFKTYLNPNAFLFYAAYLLFVAIANLLPIGRAVDGQQTRIGRLQYRINGFLTGFLALIAFGVLEYKGYKISDFILNNSLQLTIVGWIYGALLAIALYIKGGRTSVANLNMYALTNNRIYDFWQGRETNPRLGPLDVKFTFIRATLIGSILVSAAVVVKVFQASQPLSLSTINLTAVIAAILQIVYLLDGLLFEAAFVTSFEIMYEGTGYMLCTAYLMYPFICTLPARFALYNNIHQSPYVLSGLAFAFFVGYGLYRYSNSQKDLFRRNPLAPSLARLETIPTVRGKKLMVSGVWGHVRHPNYLGDIILHWSTACLSLAKDILPYYSAIFVTLVLIHRATRDSKRCHQRYGLAWEEYCSRVKYMILKRVF